MTATMMMMVSISLKYVLQTQTDYNLPSYDYSRSNCDCMFTQVLFFFVEIVRYIHTNYPLLTIIRYS